MRLLYGFCVIDRSTKYLLLEVAPHGYNVAPKRRDEGIVPLAIDKNTTKQVFEGVGFDDVIPDMRDVHGIVHGGRVERSEQRT